MKKIGSTIVMALFMATMAIAGGEKVQLVVKGMTCGGCASNVDKAIKSVDGVTSSDVSFETALASIEFDNEKISVKDIIKSIEKAGYQANIATEKDMQAAATGAASAKTGDKKACCAGKDKSSCAGKSHSSCSGKGKAKTDMKEEIAK